MKMSKGAHYKQKAALTVVGLAVFIDMLIYGLVVPILPRYADSLGATQTEIGFLFSSYAIALFIATPIFGLLTDRIGRKTPLLWGLIGLIASTLMFAIAHTFWLLVLARALQGVAAAMTWTAGLALLAELYPSEERGKAMGLALSGQAAGTLLGPTIGGWLYQWGSYQFPFYLAIALAVVDAVLRLVLLHDITEEKNEKYLSPFSFMKNKDLLLVIGVVIIGASVPSVLEPTLPLHLQHNFNANPGVIGLLFAIPTLAYGLATPFIGQFSSKIGYKNGILLGLLMVSIALPLTALPAILSLQAVILAVLGVSMGMVLAPCLPQLADISQRSGIHSYGITFALYNTAYSIGLMIGPILSSTLTDLMNIKLSYLVIGIIVLIYMLVLASALRKAKNSSNNIKLSK
ncbi:MFS transporter [Paenibacillus sp. AK121]|uniref:MFS transporter n=1 Tax=Paenibacillus sp. AK121 TaxID=2849670 RepID=UPI001C2330EF|nr:MFS transporter [Paenibacillus sp. AK121]MBU9707062.1 MFS transporter [Paenibacillus sp. AK121]